MGNNTKMVEKLFTTPKIKVTPHPVIEGGNMTLTCGTSLHPHRHNTQLQVTFYREGRIVQGSGVSDIYGVYNVQLEDSGKYSCEVETTDRKVKKRSAEQVIQIEELVAHPTITVTNDVYEGDPMTLTCKTTLKPSTKPTEVQFAFCKDGRTVQGFTSSNKYEVQAAHLEDCGNYTCEVKTRETTRSYGVYIQVQELFTTPKIKVNPQPVFKKANMVLKCVTSLHPPRRNTQLWVTFFRQGRIVQGSGVRDIFEVHNVQLEDSGKYSCEMETTDGRVRKKSAEQVIKIEEPFSQPSIVVTSDVYEGDPMTLTCNTALSPYIKPTEVQFAFYRDGRTLQEFTSYNKYEVYSAFLEDSGYYTCEVRTSTATTTTSNRVYIQIQSRNANMGYTQQNIIRLTLSACVIIAAALLVFYHITWVKSMEAADTATVY
ncbi:Fc receptor-like protein 6 [Dendropsophus ebraccatus]|uniref:Fc receptor-like protein 6 n=1 Tax=Dendropsophus ebraccatus TaxID=150705 RepID=UPI0038322D39